MAAVVRFLRLPQQTAAGDDLMTYRMRVHELDTVIEARRELAAEVRESDRFAGQPGDQTTWHDAWEVLLNLGRAGRKFTRSVLQPASREAG